MFNNKNEFIEILIPVNRINFDFDSIIDRFERCGVDFTPLKKHAVEENNDPKSFFSIEWLDPRGKEKEFINKNLAFKHFIRFCDNKIPNNALRIPEHSLDTKSLKSNDLSKILQDDCKQRIVNFVFSIDTFFLELDEDNIKNQEDYSLLVPDFKAKDYAEIILKNASQGKGLLKPALLRYLGRDLIQDKTGFVPLVPELVRNFELELKTLYSLVGPFGFMGDQQFLQLIELEKSSNPDNKIENQSYEGYFNIIGSILFLFYKKINEFFSQHFDFLSERIADPVLQFLLSKNEDYLRINSEFKGIEKAFQSVREKFKKYNGSLNFSAFKGSDSIPRNTNLSFIEENLGKTKEVKKYFQSVLFDQDTFVNIANSLLKKMEDEKFENILELLHKKNIVSDSNAKIFLENIEFCTILFEDKKAYFSAILSIKNRFSKLIENQNDFSFLARLNKFLNQKFEFLTHEDFKSISRSFEENHSKFFTAFQFDSEAEKYFKDKFLVDDPYIESFDIWHIVRHGNFGGFYKKPIEDYLGTEIKDNFTNFRKLLTAMFAVVFEKESFSANSGLKPLSLLNAVSELNVIRNSYEMKQNSNNERYNPIRKVSDFSTLFRTMLEKISLTFQVADLDFKNFISAKSDELYKRKNTEYFEIKSLADCYKYFLYYFEMHLATAIFALDSSRKQLSNLLFKDTKEKKQGITLIDFGAGPCTSLFALIFHKAKFNVLNDKKIKLTYYGIDKNEIWKEFFDECIRDVFIKEGDSISWKQLCTLDEINLSYENPKEIENDGNHLFFCFSYLLDKKDLDLAEFLEIIIKFSMNTKQNQEIVIFHQNIQDNLISQSNWHELKRKLAEFLNVELTNYTWECNSISGSQVDYPTMLGWYAWKTSEDKPVYTEKLRRKIGTKNKDVVNLAYEFIRIARKPKV